ncbi:tryptophan--tRNA ligase [Telmatocola sphagniphila]|nr:tryptophan--tRNA ligase [Telmatocola sphagniphila]
MKLKRILSGVQPSGKLHIGNYFGAIRQHIALQNEGECFYFIADYHSMTTIQNAKTRLEHVRDVALDYLALGLDPSKALLFRQSDVPEVCELAWILGTVSNMSLMEKAHSYKDKIAKGIEASIGLFTYPVLMAADILIYRSNLVPVGQDQVQHIEITRDLAEKFHRAYGKEVFPLPEHRLDVGAKVPGVDGQKMSKSYGNTIEIFAEGNPLKKTIMGIVTDSTPVEAPKNPENDTIFTLFSLFAYETEIAELANRYRAGGLGYGDSKKMLLEKVNGYFGPFREKRKELASRPDYVEDVLRTSARKARAEAIATMEQVREASGFLKQPISV